MVGFQYGRHTALSTVQIHVLFQYYCITCQLCRSGVWESWVMTCNEGSVLKLKISTEVNSKELKKCGTSSIFVGKLAASGYGTQIQ